MDMKTVGIVVIVVALAFTIYMEVQKMCIRDRP